MMPPLPLPKTTEGRLILALAVLAALLVAAGAQIVRLQGVIDTRPAVQDRIITRTVQGPTRIEVRTITKPGGERIVERIRTVEKLVTERDIDHSEAPAALPARMRYVGLGVDPLAYARLPRLRAGVTLFKCLDTGLAYDPRFSPVSGAVQIEVAYRF